MYYIAHDADWDCIRWNVNPNSMLLGFDSKADMEEWARDTVENGDWKFEGLEEADVGDCWLQFPGRPKRKKVILATANSLGFEGDVDGLIIRRPGQHPGGEFTWVEINDPMFVVVSSEIVDDDEGDEG